MKFLIAGVGAIGGTYLSFLTRAGYRAVGLVKKGKKVSRLSVKGLWGEFTVPVETVESAEELDFTPDLIVVSVKAYDTEKVLREVAPAVGENTLLLIAQNGYGNYEKAVELYGEGKVILSRVIFGAKRRGEEVRITVCGDDVVIGDPSGLLEEELLEELAQLFSSAGIPTRHEREVYAYLWEKIVYNCALNPLGALFEKTYGELADNPRTRELMEKVIEEAYEVIGAEGIKTFHEDAEEYKRHFFEKLLPPTRGHYPSMLEDLKKGKTEIEALNGALVELARRRGLFLPVNEFLTKMVKAGELFYSSTSP